MKKKAFQYLLVMTLAGVLAIANAVAQPAGKYDTGEGDHISGALAQWSGKFPNIDPARPYLVFMISVKNCLGCGASGINYAIKGIEESSRPMNILVVVATETAREGIALKRMFRTRNVVEDSPQRLKTLFGFSNDVPEMVLIQDGMVMLHQNDIQHEPVNIDTVVRAAGRKEAGSAIVERNTLGRELQEDDDHIVIGAGAMKVDGRGRTLTLLDPSTGDVVRFDLDSGKRLGTMVVPATVGEYFRDPADTGTPWKVLRENYSPLARVDDIVRAYPDSIELLARMFTGYDLVPLPDGRKRAMFRVSMALLNFTITGDSALDLVRLRTIDAAGHTALAPVLKIGESSYVMGALSEQALDDSVWAGNHRDSIFTLLSMQGTSAVTTPFMSLHELEQRFGIASTVEDVRYLVSAGDDIYCFDGSGGLLRGTPGAGASGYHRIELGGALAAMYRHPSDSYHPPADPAIIDRMIVNGVLAAEKSLHVLMSGTDTSTKSSYMVVQDYRDGIYAGEKWYQYSVDDELMNMVPGGYDGQDIILLVKWKRARWTIERIPSNVADRR